jgi:hypothetical protein
MNKTTRILYLAMATIGFTACGDTISERERDPIEDPTAQSYAFVELSDLKDGYSIRGTNLDGLEMKLDFCFFKYDYSSGKRNWHGSYSINSDRINLFDETPTGGSYRIDTITSLLEVGELYTIDFQDDEILVEEILEDLDCN